MYSVVLGFSKIERGGVAHSKYYTGQHYDACLDFNFPFRPLLDFLAECLWQDGMTVDLDLPDYMECFNMRDTASTMPNSGNLTGFTTKPGGDAKQRTPGS